MNSIVIGLKRASPASSSSSWPSGAICQAALPLICIFTSPPPPPRQFHSNDGQKERRDAVGGAICRPNLHITLKTRLAASKPEVPLPFSGISFSLNNVILVSFWCHFHVIFMSFSSHFQVISNYLPWQNHDFIMSFWCHFHIIFMSFSCHFHVILGHLNDMVSYLCVIFMSLHVIKLTWKVSRMKS